MEVKKCTIQELLLGNHSETPVEVNGTLERTVDFGGYARGRVRKGSEYIEFKAQYLDSGWRNWQLKELLLDEKLQKNVTLKGTYSSHEYFNQPGELLIFEIEKDGTKSCPFWHPLFVCTN